MKQHYFLKLLPPRPTFAQDRNEAERHVMQQHVVYWAGLLKKGIAIVYGPVMDPVGVYGVGIVEVENDEQLKQCMDNDPASGLNRYESFSMRAVTQPWRAEG